MPAADVTLEHSYLRIYKTMKGRGNRELRNQAELVFQGFTTANVIAVACVTKPNVNSAIQGRLT